MNELLKKEFELRLINSGYFILICDDNIEKEKFLNFIKENFPQIKLIDDYRFCCPPDDKIVNNLKNNPVLLLNVEENLEKNISKLREISLNKYEKEISVKEGIYLSLIWLRESARDNPLLVICNSDTAYEIIHNDVQLSAFARNYMYVDKNYGKKKIYKKFK